MENQPIQRAAVIDIGTNSIKLMIGQEQERDIKVLESLKQIVPLGRDTFFKGRISQEIINQTVRILQHYKQIIQEYDVHRVIAIATTAVREARNQDIFLDAVFRKTGIPVEVLNIGDVVYYLNVYLSHTLKNKYPIHKKNVCIAEIGAGSLDVSLLKEGFTLMNIGLSLGTLTLKQFMTKIGGPSHEAHEAIREYIESELGNLRRNMPKSQMDDIILIDENFSVYLDSILTQKRTGVQFFPFEITDAEELLTKLKDKNAQEIESLYKVPSDIADRFVIYALLVHTFFSLTKNKSLYILQTSLSEAVLGDILLNLELSEKYNKLNQLITIAEYLCNKYDLDVKHAQYVTHLSEVLFDSLKDYLGLRQGDKLYLIFAAYLHDIGSFIHNRSHHKHSEYVISSLDLFRLTEEEIRVIACIGRYHRKGFPMHTHELYNSLSPQDQILVQKLAAIVRIANAFDRSHTQKVQKLKVETKTSADIILTVSVKESFLLEKADFLEKKELFEEITGSKINLVIKQEA